MHVNFIGDTHITPHPYVQAGTKRRAWLISTLHVGPDHPNPRPNPDPKPNPHPHPNPLGGSRSKGAVTRRAAPQCVLWRFSINTPSGRKAGLDQKEQHPAQSFVPTSPAHMIGRTMKDRGYTVWYVALHLVSRHGYFLFRSLKISVNLVAIFVLL